MSIELLDCTLRDGGYINNWEFSDQQIINTILLLDKANIESIECGYLSNKNSFAKDSTRFNSLESINNTLRIIKDKISSKLFMMMDFGDYDLSKLKNNNVENVVNNIRFAFHKKDLLNIYLDLKNIDDKGYQIFLQPMITSSYSNDELLRIIDYTNKLNLSALYIVDSLGNMYFEELERIFLLMDSNLKPKIKIGFHAHNNLQLAYYNAINLTKLVNKSNRNIVIDSSVTGLGRGGGNLKTELILSYLSSNSYNIFPLLDLIDNDLKSAFADKDLYQETLYTLSAFRGCHPSYLKYFSEKKLSLSYIKNLIDSIDDEYLTSFTLKYADTLIKKSSTFLFERESNNKNSLIE